MMIRTNITFIIYIFLCLGMVLASRQRIPILTILNDPDHVTVEEGQAAVLPCAVKHLGTKTVIWRKSNSNHPLTISRMTFTDDKRVMLDDGLNWDLRIEDVTTSDSGIYQCQVSDIKLLSGSVTLEVTQRKVTSSLPSSLPPMTQTKTLTTPFLEATPLPDGHDQRTSPSSDITDEMLRSAQLEYYREEILTNKKRRQVMDAEQEFYEAMTAFLSERKKMNGTLN